MDSGVDANADAATTNQRIVLFGGASSPPTTAGEGNSSFNDTWLFDGAEWTLVSTSMSPSMRYNVQAATVGGQLLLVSGWENVTEPGPIFQTEEFQDTWLFDGSSWANPTEATFPSGRGYGAMASLGATSAVLFGGYDVASEATLGDTWVFDGTAWTPSMAMGPGPGNSFAAAALGGVALFFGGTNDSSGNPEQDNQTWTFDGMAWTRLTPTSPPPIGTYEMASLGAHVVLFGSPDDGMHHEVTWTFDGTQWSQVTTAHSPPWREFFMMAPLGGDVIVFGGEDMTGALINDTWMFDGADWTELFPSGALPPPRAQAAMATLPQ